MKRGSWDGVILALDLATVIGWCKGHTQCAAPTWGTHILPSGGSDAAAAIALSKWLRPIFTHTPPDLVAKETAPSIMAFKGKTNARTLERLRTLATKTEEICLEFGIHCVDVDATQWRKPLTGQARFPKHRRPYPAIAALEQIGFLVSDHNAADAFGVWLYAQAWRNPDASVKFHPLSRASIERRKSRTAEVSV